MLSLVKKSSIKQFVVYCFGCKENGGLGGGGGLINFMLLKGGALLDGGGLFNRGDLIEDLR